MGNGIHNQLHPTERRILGNGDKKVILSLIGMYLHTGGNMHHQHTVGQAVYVCTIYEMHLNIYRRDTEVERCTQQFIQMLLVAIDTRDSAIVLNAYHHIATIGIGKGNEYDPQRLGIYPETLAVEKLSFRLLL